MTSFTFKLPHTTGSAVKAQRFPFIFSETPGVPATVVVVTTVVTDLFIFTFWAAYLRLVQLCYYSCQVL